MRQRAPEIENVLIRVTEGIGLRVLFDRIVRDRVFEMLEGDRAFKSQFRRIAAKVATATELSKGSCSQRSCVGWGVIAR